MRTDHAFAAVLAATLFAAPALADTYRDAAPAMTEVAAPNAPQESSHGFGAGQVDSPRSDRNWGDDAPVIVMNPGSVSAPGRVDASQSEGTHSPFKSLRF